MPYHSPETVLRRLKKLYPDAACTLDYATPLDLLVATILSAQCTDKRVNVVTKSLFKKYRTPADYLSVALTELEHDIHSCGTFRAKARAIRETSKTLIDRFGGKVPRTMEDMLTLRGVGRKTAAVVLSTVFRINEGIAVDTHVMRVSQRLGLTKATSPTNIEADLRGKFPRAQWGHISHLLIAHGRAICTARTVCHGECLFGKHKSL